MGKLGIFGEIFKKFWGIVTYGYNTNVSKCDHWWLIQSGLQQTKQPLLSPTNKQQFTKVLPPTPTFHSRICKLGIFSILGLLNKWLQHNWFYLILNCPNITISIHFQQCQWIPNNTISFLCQWYASTRQFLWQWKFKQMIIWCDKSDELSLSLTCE